MKYLISEATRVPVIFFQNSVYSYAAAAALLIGIPIGISVGSPLVVLEFILISCGFLLSYGISRLGYSYAALIIGILTITTDVVLAVWNFRLDSGIQFYLLTMCTILSASPRLNRKVILIIDIIVLSLFFSLPFIFKTPAHPLGPTAGLLFSSINSISAFAVILISFHRFSNALQKAELEISDYHDVIHLAAHTDNLTGLANRNALQEHLRQCSESIRENGSPFMIGILDVDNFKNVNDTYGHNSGDEALKIIAGSLQVCLREEDVIGRWGGEEFLIILKTGNEEAALKTFERVRQSVEDASFFHEEKRVPLSITIGVTKYTQHDNIDSAVSRADKFLYEGKRSGKNRVVSDITSEL